MRKQKETGGIIMLRVIMYRQRKGLKNVKRKCEKKMLKESERDRNGNGVLQYCVCSCEVTVKM